MRPVEMTSAAILPSHCWWLYSPIWREDCPRHGKPRISLALTSSGVRTPSDSRTVVFTSDARHVGAPAWLG